MTRRINRLASMLLDHITMLIVLFPLMIFAFIFVIIFIDSSYPDLTFFTNSIGNTILFTPFVAYFLKDSYRGKSIGKRVIGLQVINRSTNLPANALQCFIRNLLIPIWPLEVLISLFSPARRLGDIIANTKVVVVKKENLKTIFKDIRQTKFSLRALLILIIGLVYCYFLGELMMAISHLPYEQ